MKFFIDTASVDEIKAANAMGILDGVTTNPSLAARESAPYKEILTEICKVVSGPVSAEVIATEHDGMISEADELLKIADNIVVKIPTILEGLKAIKTLTTRGVKTNATLVFSPIQALMVAKAGATYVSPFIGRLDDIATSGMELISHIAENACSIHPVTGLLFNRYQSGGALGAEREKDHNRHSDGRAKYHFPFLVSGLPLCLPHFANQ